MNNAKRKPLYGDGAAVKKLILGNNSTNKAPTTLLQMNDLVLSSIAGFLMPRNANKVHKIAQETLSPVSAQFKR